MIRNEKNRIIYDEINDCLTLQYFPQKLSYSKYA